MERSYEDIVPQTLEFLRDLAGRERHAFFERNPEAAEFYENRYIAACLCQGAAWHYVEEGDGVKDFDIHLFFWQHPERHIVSRRPKPYVEVVPNFGERRCDVLKTVVPTRFRQSNGGDIPTTLQRFLEETPTDNAWHLAQKAVVGLSPDRIFGEVVWE